MDSQEQITHLIPKLTELFPMIEVLYLFGSRAFKTNKADSDIDLAVFVNKQHNPHDPLLDLKIGIFFDEHLKKKLILSL
jgi:predicted nucleotidyltransferase